MACMNSPQLYHLASQHQPACHASTSLLCGVYLRQGSHPVSLVVSQSVYQQTCILVYEQLLTIHNPPKLVLNPVVDLNYNCKKINELTWGVELAKIVSLPSIWMQSVLTVLDLNNLILISVVSNFESLNSQILMTNGNLGRFLDKKNSHKKVHIL